MTPNSSKDGKGTHSVVAPVAITKASRAPVPSAFPDWLKRRMEAAGLMDPNTGAARRARARRCDKCQAPVMRGISEEFGGLSADADPTPLSGYGEVLARMAGRNTYELTWNGMAGYTMSYRTASRIKGRPAGTPMMEVLVGHLCGGGSFPSAEHSIKDNTTPTQPLPDRAPF